MVFLEAGSLQVLFWLSGVGVVGITTVAIHKLFCDGALDSLGEKAADRFVKIVKGKASVPLCIRLAHGSPFRLPENVC